MNLFRLISRYFLLVAIAIPGTFWYTISSVIMAQETTRFSGTGTITFLSEAPAEVIKARSDQLEGILDLKENTFAFIVPVNSFEGFNSALQREHFNEHYLETQQFPHSTFAGKVIGLQNCEVDCETEIFAKGKLTIHGVTKIVTIPVRFSRNGHSISAKADFQVALSDYDIHIPLILTAKISPIIYVYVDVRFQPKNE